MANDAAVATQPQQVQPAGLVVRFADKFGVESNKMMTTLKNTVFRGDVSNEQMMALLIVADQYNLNPFTKEIYAFPDKNNGIVPVVGVDGWARIINEHPQFDGMDFTDGPADKAGLPEWIECAIHRKDRQRPTVVREYMAECKRTAGPWQSHPRRMLRHKTLIQCARLAFGFVGIHDEDEAQRIIEGSATTVAQPSKAIEAINKRASSVIESAATRTAEAPTQPAAPDKPATGTHVDTQTGEIFPAPTFSEVQGKIKAAIAAKDRDAFDLAQTLIADVPDEAHKAMLRREVLDGKEALA
jgi:phage recombination protein Bet